MNEYIAFENCTFQAKKEKKIKVIQECLDKAYIIEVIATMNIMGFYLCERFL